MSSNNAADFLRVQLEEFIVRSFGPNDSFEVIRAGILTNPAFSSLDQGQLKESLDAIAATRGGGEQPARLLVDWGELPQVGREARPLFSLLTTHSVGRPKVTVRVDRSLDNDPTDPLRQLRMEDSGLWTFYIPFRLTSDGLDAKPGLYVIDVEVTFPHTENRHPRFLQTRIRLNIPDGSSDQRELIIDGDGQSVVNLAGHDLRSFSKVVLKGDDRGIINLQNFGQPQDPAAQPEKPVVFEYDLKINREIHERLPRLVPMQQPSRAEAITLVAGEKRIHVIARKRTTFGRSRENDVCLRFWPRSAEHDQGSRNISKTHMAVMLSDDGLVLSDEGSTHGFDVDCDPVKEEKTLTHLDAHGSRQVDLPSPLSAKHSLEMELAVFGRDPDDAEFHTDLDWDDVCFDTIGESPSRLWHVAKGCGIESARIRRLSNLPDEEYVFLYRHATIGRSAKDNAIVLPIFGTLSGDLRLVYVGRVFHLHSTGRATLAVDGKPIHGPCLVPLMFGHCLTINGEDFHIARLAQFHLHDDPVLRTPPQESPPAPPPSPVVPVRADQQNNPSSPPPPPVQALRATGAAHNKTPSAAGPQADSTPLAQSEASTDDPVASALASVAVITGGDGHGSGFLIAPGILATNYHVIADDPVEHLTAEFFDPATHEKTSLPVSLLSEDPEHDLAFLSVETSFTPLPLSHLFNHRNGHRVSVIGSPGVGEHGERLENVVTDGRLGPQYSSLIAPDRWSLSITLNPGNSGGPVLDAATGEVLGVAVAKFTTVDGLALAVPHAILADRLRQVAAHSKEQATASDSLHRQRYCLRRISGFVSAARSALDDFSEQYSEVTEEASTLNSESVAVQFSETYGDSIISAIDALGAELTPQLAHLRKDNACRQPVLDDLERGWAELAEWHNLFSTSVSEGSPNSGLTDLTASLTTVEELCNSLRLEIEGSLLNGRTVFDSDPSGTRDAPRLQQVAMGGGAGQLSSSEILRSIVLPPAKPKPRYLTKSRFTLACSCPTKLFYTSKTREYANNRSDDPTMQSLANEGNRVGALARLYFPEGTLIETLNHDAALAQTDELLARDDVTIFEAAIRADDLFIRADILRKTGDSIQLFEVKSKVYSEADDGDLTTASGIASAWLSYVRDVAFQRHVLSRAFPQAHLRAFLFLPDKSKTCPSFELAAKCRAATDGEAAALTSEEQASPLMRAINVDTLCDTVLGSRYLLDGRSLSFSAYADTLAEAYREDRRCPPVLSPACLTCEFENSSYTKATGLKSGRQECWARLLDWSDADFEKPLAFDIGGLSAAKKRTLLDERRLHLDQVTEADIAPADDGQPGLSQSQRQWLQVRKTVDGETSSYFDRDGLQAEMATWQFPLHFIDFETCRAVIPFHAGSRPSTLIAFQFSHHVMAADGSVSHANEFLCTEPGLNPNAGFVAALHAAVGDTGTILHYAPHEVSTLRAIAVQLRARHNSQENTAELLAFIDSIAPPGDQTASRSVVDLCKLVKRFYYAPSMRGSNSIKDVLPAILHESEFLQQRYGKPIYGASGGIPSKNFTDMTWVQQRDGGICDPYALLPATVPAASGDGPANRPAAVLRNGGAAMQAYADLQLCNWPASRRQATEQALLRYCELDTLAMVFIVEAWRYWCR